MAKWFWQTYLIVAAFLLMMGILWIFSTVVYGLQAWSSWALGPVYAAAGVVATAVGIYALLRAQKLYDRSKRNGGVPPARPQNAR